MKGFQTFLTGNSLRRIKIHSEWRVLDIGSGHNPHPRADVLLDKDMAPSPERGGFPSLRGSRPFVLGDAQHLPFKDKSFDLVLACQVAEHVEDPVLFCRELVRVAHRGYIECPGALTESVLGEPFHLWLVSRRAGGLIFKRKRRNLKASDLFYALFYAGQTRAKRTFTLKGPSGPLLRALSLLLQRFWRMPGIRRFTYTSFEFQGEFHVLVVG
ncbi:MAG TPA: class I SAM-dependent methyltransferase [Candidatus Latescibacteria bacterium]|nr:class I SAM-dependent methyltransferase [Candidatus Latescibacterota bacterium]